MPTSPGSLYQSNSRKSDALGWFPQHPHSRAASWIIHPTAPCPQAAQGILPVHKGQEDKRQGGMEMLRHPKQDGERKAVASELGREETRASPARKQSSHTHCRFLLQRGEKRGGGKWQQEGSRRERREIQHLQTCPHCWLLCCVQYLISQSLESPWEGWKPDAPKSGKIEEMRTQRCVPRPLGEKAPSLKPSQPPNSQNP